MLTLLVFRPPPANPVGLVSLDAKQDFGDLLQQAWESGELQRVTLAGPRGRDRSVRQINIRPVELRGETQLSFVYRHETKDVTRNFAAADGLKLILELAGVEFSHAYLQTPQRIAHLEYPYHRPARLRFEAPRGLVEPARTHDLPKVRRIETDRPWLQALGVTTREGAVCRGMEAKFRQIHRFVELLEPLVEAAAFPAEASLRVVDMGCGKGYLTFAACEHLQQTRTAPVQVCGVEARPELVTLTSRVAREADLPGLSFLAGSIAAVPPGPMDILIALHACDTATDDALAAGVAAGAGLLMVAPCCHKELRPRLVPPAVLAGALRHGILLQREAEFVTDALRAALLEWAGYDTRVMEFIAPEHTSKNLMIAAVKRRGPHDREGTARRVRELAAFYGIRAQHLAARLNFSLAAADESPAPAEVTAP